MKMQRKTIQTGVMRRTAVIERGAVDEEARTVELAFSSEAPVERWFGNEILDHGPGSVRLGRMEDGGPLLVDHRGADHVGVVESVSIGSDRVGRALVRFGSSARASEIFRDVVDGIRRKVSVGYRIYRMVLEETGQDGETYRVTDWEPLEISLVAVPADPSVGVGRSAGGEQFETIVERNMNDDDKHTDQGPTEATRSAGGPEPAGHQRIDLDRHIEEARRAELQRITDIETLGNELDQRDLARQHIAEGKSLDEFRAALLKRIGKAKPAASPELGLTEREARRFSFLRAIHALANPGDRRAQEAAAFEREVSEAVAKKLGREQRGFIVPDSLRANLDPRVLREPQRLVVPVDVLKRDLTVGTATAGGHTVATDLMAQDFIDLLRNRTVVFARATRLADLVGNVAIPRQTGGATAYWVTEGNAPTESQQAFDQVTLSPNTVGAFTDFSRKLILQSSMDVEAFVRRDLATVLGLEIDRTCINGSGSGAQPVGILNTTGIGSVAGGTNGAAPTWAHIVTLETEVAQDNADVGSLFYITNTKVRGKLKQTEKASGTAQFVWGDGAEPLNSYGALVTNQVPSNLTKGTGSGLSAIIFGNLADLLVGLWSGLDLLVDPYTASTTGTVRVVAMQDIDIAVRHAESFAAMQDAITT